MAKVQGGWADFDVAVATNETMKEVRKLGKVLGPRGLMPNPKTGTVTEDTAAAVKLCKVLDVPKLANDVEPAASGELMAQQPMAQEHAGEVTLF